MPPVVLSIIWLMPYDFKTPPVIIQNTPVPAQAIHSKSPGDRCRLHWFRYLNYHRDDGKMIFHTVIFLVV
jgi:hypothetical protein